jgi:hypothetical protein
MKERTVWLDSLGLSLADQAAGSAMSGKSMWNNPLSIAGKVPAHDVLFLKLSVKV